MAKKRGEEWKQERKGKQISRSVQVALYLLSFFLFFNHDDNPNDTTPENEKISVKGYNL